MSVTGDFAGFVSKTSYGDLPQDVAQKAKKLILDLLGSIIYSSKMDWSKKVVTLVKGFKAPGKSTVIPFGFGATAPAVALANGTMGHGFELDDVHDGGMHHPGAVVIPAALAAGETESALRKLQGNWSPCEGYLISRGLHRKRVWEAISRSVRCRLLL